MKEPLHFNTRLEFRNWLSDHCLMKDGVWLLFSKTKEVKTLKASEALEEALCFGWIDGIMKRLDDKTYIKYFALRRPNSKWSEKNKALIHRLDELGLMTEYGWMKIEEAKQNGQWDHVNQQSVITDELIETTSLLLKEHPQAYKNFLSMPLSVKKTYTRAYLDAKTETGRQKRLSWMIDRLSKNLKPM